MCFFLSCEEGEGERGGGEGEDTEEGGEYEEDVDGERGEEIEEVSLVIETSGKLVEEERGMEEGGRASDSVFVFRVKYL